MALTSAVLSTSQTAVNIHDHHQKSTHDANGEQKNMAHDMSKSKIMDNCLCTDCDCVQNIAGQANSSFVHNRVLTGYLPVVNSILVTLEQNFNSQPHTNPFRPPIIT